MCFLYFKMIQLLLTIFAIYVFIYFSMLGTPNESLWPGVSELKDYKSDFPKWKPQPFSNILPMLDTNGIDLIEVSFICEYSC